VTQFSDNYELTNPTVDCSGYIIDPFGEYVKSLNGSSVPSTVVTPVDVVIDEHSSLYNLTVGHTGLLGCFCGALEARSAKVGKKLCVVRFHVFRRSTNKSLCVNPNTYLLH